MHVVLAEYRNAHICSSHTIQLSTLFPLHQSTAAKCAAAAAAVAADEDRK